MFRIVLGEGGGGIVKPSIVYDLRTALSRSTYNSLLVHFSCMYSSPGRAVSVRTHEDGLGQTLMLCSTAAHDVLSATTVIFLYLCTGSLVLSERAVRGGGEPYATE